MTCEAKHECGIAAVSLKDNGNAADKALFYLYKILLNLQNRGQLSAGITTYNPKRPQLINTYRNIGTVNEVFRTSKKQKSMELFKRYAGRKGIGHVRYATCGANDRAFAQPFERHHGRKWKWFSFCFNGNLANYHELKEQLLKKKDYHMTLDNDTEIVMHYMSREFMGPSKPKLTDVFGNLAKRFDGSYNIAFINAFGDIAANRGPLGNRPLVYAEEDGNLLVSSESNALVNCGFNNFKSLEPGKLIFSENGSIEIKKYTQPKRIAHCMFEWVYFANVGSVLDDKSVYITRTNLGKELAKLETEDISEDHIVVPVPDTAKAAGDSMAFELGAPAQEGLIRNRFVGRTFIEGVSRGDKVANKYTAIREILKGKKILLVDDSVVRGTTTKQLVRYLKTVGGAKEVHVRVSCPPILGPCFYGIDMSSMEELLIPGYIKKNVNPDAFTEKVEAKVAKDLEADSVIYQRIPGLIKSIGLPKENLCMACLNGDYPTNCGRKLYCQSLKNFQSGKKSDKRIYEVC